MRTSYWGMEFAPTFTAVAQWQSARLKAEDTECRDMSIRD